MIKKFICDCGYELLIVTDYKIDNKIPKCKKCQCYMKAIEAENE